jgi:hypothetical protein
VIETFGFCFAGALVRVLVVTGSTLARNGADC